MRGRFVVLIGGIIVAASVFTAWVGSDPQIAQTAFPPFSSRNTADGGTSLAYAYLQDRLGEQRVGRLLTDIDASTPAGAVVFRLGAAAPTRAAIKPAKGKTAKNEIRLRPLLSESEEAWIRGGGRLIIATATGYGPLEVKQTARGPMHMVFPLFDEADVQLSFSRALSGPALQDFHSVVAAGDDVVMARSRIGNGEVIAFSLPEALTNSFIGNAGHLALLENLADSGRMVLFDDAIHGMREDSSLTTLLVRDWNLGPAIGLMIVAALLQFWRRSRTVADADREVMPVRSDTIDLVDSVGRLYDGSVDRHGLLRMYHEGLVRAVRARTGLTGDALAREVQKRAPGFNPSPRLDDISREQFRHDLSILNRAFESVIHADTH